METDSLVELRETKRGRCQVRVEGVAGFAISTPESCVSIRVFDASAGRGARCGLHRTPRRLHRASGKQGGGLTSSVDVTINPCLIGARFFPLPSHLARNLSIATHRTLAQGRESDHNVHPSIHLHQPFQDKCENKPANSIMKSAVRCPSWSRCGDRAGMH